MDFLNYAIDSLLFGNRCNWYIYVRFFDRNALRHGSYGFEDNFPFLMTKRKPSIFFT